MAIKLIPSTITTGTSFKVNGKTYDRIAVTYHWGGVTETPREVGVYHIIVTHTWNKHESYWAIKVEDHSHSDYLYVPRIEVHTDEMGLPLAPVIRLRSHDGLPLHQVAQVMEALKQAHHVAMSIHQQLVIPIQRGVFQLPTDLHGG